jgi:hypothetical protein
MCKMVWISPSYLLTRHSWLAYLWINMLTWFLFLNLNGIRRLFV